MKLQNKVKDIRRRYVAAFPVPQGEPGEAFEEVARQWSFRFSEQVRFECPGEDYGMKRADPGRPVSKDTLALSLLDRLLVWDLLTGTGTGHPMLVEDPDSQDVTGQIFIPVEPKNHIGTAGPVDPGQPQPQPPLMDFERLVLHELAVIDTRLDALDQKAERIAQAAQHLKPAPRKFSGTMPYRGQKLTVEAEP